MDGRRHSVFRCSKGLFPDIFCGDQVVLDTDGSGRVSYKQFVMAFKEAKGAGRWLEGGLEGEASLHTLLSALAVRGREQGNSDFRKACHFLLLTTCFVFILSLVFDHLL